MKRLMSMESLRKRQHGHSASIHSNHSSASLVGAQNVAIRQSPPTTYQNDKYMIPVIDVRPGADDYSHSQELAGDDLLVRRIDDHQVGPKPRGHKSRPLPVPNSQSPNANPSGTAINPFHISLSVSRKRRPLPQPNQMGSSPYSSSGSSHAHSHSGSSNMTNHSHFHGVQTVYSDSSSLHVPRSSPAHSTTFPQVRKNERQDERGRTPGATTTSPPLLPPLDFGSTESLFNGHTPRFSVLFPPNLLEARVLPDVPSSAPAVHMVFNVPPPPSHPPPVIPPRSEARKRTPSPLRTQTNLTSHQRPVVVNRDARVDSLIAPPLNFDPRHASVLQSPTPGMVHLVVPESVQHRFGSSFVPASPQPTEPARPPPTAQYTATPVNASNVAKPVSDSTLLAPPLTTPSSGHPSTPSSYTAVTDARHSGATKAERESRSRERPALTVRTWDLGKSGKDKPIEPVEHVPVPNFPAAPMYIKDEIQIEKERAQTLFVQNRSALESVTTLSRTTSAHSATISRSNTANVKAPAPTQPLVSQPQYRAGETIMPELEDSEILAESARVATDARKKPSGEGERGRPVRRQLPIPPTAIPSTLPQQNGNSGGVPSNPVPTSAARAPPQEKEKTQVSDVVMVQLKKMRMGRRKSKSISGWSSVNPFSSSNTSLSSNASAGGAFSSLRRDRTAPQHESRPSFSSAFASFGKRPANPYYEHARQPHSASSSRSSFSNLSLSYITSKIRSRSQSSARDPYDFSQPPHVQGQGRVIGGSAVIFANSGMGDASRGSVWEQIAASSSNVNLPLGAGQPETMGKPREEDAIARWQEGTPMEQTFYYAPPPPALVPLGESNRGAKPVSALWTKLRTKKADR